jgi:apolipoprotein D and lipocalin family protein
MKLFIACLSALSILSFGGCASMDREPLPTVPNVDLARFAGDWYVIGVIPTFLEKDAHNAVETYTLEPDGTIATTFTFRKGHFDGPLKQYHPTGFVRSDPSNAVWGMQFVWPIKAEYLIVHLDEAYTTTVVARNKRDAGTGVRAAGGPARFLGLRRRGVRARTAALVIRSGFALSRAKSRSPSDPAY